MCNDRSRAQLNYIKTDKCYKQKTKLLNKKLGGFLLFVIMASAAGMVPVFAASQALLNGSGVNPQNGLYGDTTTPAGAIDVTTDKRSYNDGDKITISGSTRDFISSLPVTVRIISPIGNIVKVDQVDLSSDKTFKTSIVGSGILWQEAGEYKVLVQYGNKDKAAMTTFLFSGSGTGQGNTIKVDGTDFSIKYSITNGKVLGIKADTQSKSLIVSIQTTADGVLTVTLPRGLINATTPDGKDSPYFVMSDGQQADFEETSNTKSDRTLAIPFTDGTTQIEIIGTQVIPEFGPIVAVVLAIAIMSIIAVSAKTGLRFMPK
jgi:predicted secreted protein with PEFG-CTERM motif